MKHIKILFPLSIFIIILCLLVSPERYSVVALNGVLVWATILLPTLFPFMFFSRLFSSFDFIESLSRKIDKLTKKIFNIPGDGVYIYLLSILCGYPIGAKLTHDLFFDGRINSGEANRIMARKFYENVGFKQVSEEFLEDGIPHILMTLEIE